MAPRRLGISEARRLLPSLVETIAAEGGRIDITRRGLPGVTLVRTSDLDVPSSTGALRVELVDPAEDLVDTVRALRARLGGARPAQSPPKAARRRS